MTTAMSVLVRLVKGKATRRIKVSTPEWMVSRLAVLGSAQRSKRVQ